MLSNFPVWLFDAEAPQWPTFGLKLVQKDPKASLAAELPQPVVPRGGVSQVVGYLRSLVDTMMAAHDRLYIEEHDFEERTIAIDTLGVGTTEFDLSSQRAGPLPVGARRRPKLPAQAAQERRDPAPVRLFFSSPAAFVV
jgi:NTE family protein